MCYQLVCDLLFLSDLNILIYDNLFADFLAVGSDSGRMVILEYNPTKNCFEKVGKKLFHF